LSLCDLGEPGDAGVDTVAFGRVKELFAGTAVADLSELTMAFPEAFCGMVDLVALPGDVQGARDGGQGVDHYNSHHIMSVQLPLRLRFLYARNAAVCA
jgi:hypothetical protein